MKSKLLFCIIALLLCLGLESKSQSITPYAKGAGSFVYTGYTPLASRQCTVFFYVPAVGDVTKMKVLFSLHGAERSGRLQRGVWRNLAEEYGFIVVAPQFSHNQSFGENNYQFGGVSTLNFASGPYAPNSESMWSYHIIESLFDHFKASTGSTAAKYSMFGHSAGGQFVHRYTLMMPNARVDQVFAANPGNYTYPDATGLLASDGTLPNPIGWPFSLKGTTYASRERQSEFYKKKLIIGIGKLDTEDQTVGLAYNHGAVVQGVHRYERALKYYQYNREQAKLLGFEFNWKLQEIDGVGHSSAHMVYGRSGVRNWRVDGESVYNNNDLTRFGAFEALFSKTHTITVPDFSQSNVYKVMDGSTQVAQITKEYLRKVGTVNAQAIVVYPVKNDVVQLDKGYVAKIIKQYSVSDSGGDFNFTPPTTAIHGGIVSFNKTSNGISVYAPGNLSAGATTVYMSGDGAFSAIALPGAKATIATPHTITDVRGSESNTYPIVKIGAQYWMGKNLNTRKYNHKLAYATVPTAETTDISKANSSIYLQPNADAIDSTSLARRNQYGLYYSYLSIGGYANDSAIDNNQHYLIEDRLSPNGWSIPSYTEAAALRTYVGGTTNMLRLREFKNTDGSINYITAGRLDDNITGFSAPNASYRNGNGATSWAGLLAANGAWFLTRTISAANTAYVFHMVDIISSSSYKTRNYTVRSLASDAVKTSDGTADAASYSKVIFVSELGGSPVRDGSSWATAFNAAELQAALDTAAEGDVVWVAKGTYKPTAKLIPTGEDRDKSFLIKEGVQIYGGFAGNEGAGYDLAKRNFILNETILSGDLNNNNITDVADAYHVVVSAKNIFGTYLDGFSIKHGFANGSGTVPVNGFNVNRNVGGGLAAFGANTNGMFTNLVFADNKSSANGGAVYIFNDATDVDVNKSKFFRNTAQTGGAVFVAGKLGKITVANSLFYNNKATNGDGGAIYHSRANAVDTSYFALKNSTFYGNVASNRGGGFSQNGYENISTEVYNNLFYNNNSSDAGSLKDIRISSVTKRYVDFNKYTYVPITSGIGTNNLLITSPATLFETLDTLNVNFLKLAATSEVINIGSNTKSYKFPNALYNVDLASAIRIRDNVVDLGAFEYQYGTTVMPLASIAGELNSYQLKTLNSVNEQSTTKTFTVYPNPIKDTSFSILLNGFKAGKYTYKLVDISGKQIQSGTLFYNGTPLQVSLDAKLPKSVYILRVQAAGTNVYTKLITE